MIEYLAVFTITLFAVISPGPDFAMVTRNSLMLSRRAGILTAVGIGGGILVHMSYTLIGIGLIIQQSLWLFNIIKLIGAAYLIWLGVKMLRTKPTRTQSDTGIASVSDGVALRTGFLTNVLNPKTTIFIVSLFMQVVSPQTPLAVQIGYGIFISVAHISWFC
ncbi:LysE family translocator, partial [Candidatus Symbiopectobacterium sp. NZEC135]